MGVKLFRTTEFADSHSYHPGEQRRALHPAWVVAFCAFWIAVPGNWVLWASLRLVPELDGAGAAWLALRLAALLALAVAALLLLGAWRRTLRLWCSLALAASTLASLAVAGQGQLRAWQIALCVLMLTLLPALLVWRAPLRRLPLLSQARLCLGGALLCLAAAGAGLLAGRAELTALQSRAPWLAGLAVPFGPLGGSALVEQILLGRKP